ncbi:hypothetical protein MNAN1_000826 [Malassezia nana]|uniref:Uncharacterized protein n=1 Tax=Malassezia nana TaxID=180528 RepID=A0AAF0EJL0_9BASI|nr:hypothetical protein MNAN1_000826 [Malassezia nana]
MLQALGKVLVISGGSGYNDLIEVTPSAIFVMPGSSSGSYPVLMKEIIRVLGGPSIGDIRSRLVRLASLAAKCGEHKYNLGYPGSREALQRLLTYRLPMSGPIKEIKQEWMEIIEGKHRLWRGIDPEKRECVRGFLVQFHSDILHRAHRNFNFRGGSIGNFFLAAMQRFFGSIQSAIFLFSALTDISSVLPGCQVVPAINTNKTTTIAAKLNDGKMLVGQCEISHPSAESMKTSDEPAKPPPRVRRFSELQDSVLGLGQSPRLHHLALRSSLEPHSMRTVSSAHTMDDSDFSDEVDDLFEDEAFNLPEVSEALGNLMYGAKDEALPLSAPIERLFYVNSYRNEVFPAPNSAFLTGLQCSTTLVYSCGSLWSSIMPCLVLCGIPQAIARSPQLRYKVLLLNTQHDRESFGLVATDFIRYVARLTQNHMSLFELHYITHVVYARQGRIDPCVPDLEQMGIHCIGVDANEENPRLDEQLLRSAFEEMVTM